MMKNLTLYSVITMILCLSSIGYTQDIVFPKDAILVKSENIMEKPPFAECHASTIVELSAGKHMASWFGGTHESHKDVTIWVSTHQNGQWSDPLSIADGIINDTLRYPCWNPVLFKTREGKLFIFYKVGKNPREWWGMMRYSTDDGQNWSIPEKLPEGFLGAIKNKPIQLSNGDILHPSSTESFDTKIWHIHLEKCDKNGQNWVKIPIDNKGYGLIQPTILRYSKKKLQLLCRSRQNQVAQSWSNDGGQTWSAASLTNLPNPNSGVDGVTLKNGAQLLVYNPLKNGEKSGEDRSTLLVAMSKNGKDWKNIYVLEKEKRGEFSYPAIVQSADGLVHITYTLNRKNVKYVVLNIGK